MISAWNNTKFIFPDQLEQKVEKLREVGQTIVTLNGSFDLIHVGHLKIIYEASKQGDCLILALNSDDSIKQYKGSQRPIVPLEHRLQMVASFEFVNLVTFFDETTPFEFLKKVKPDIHVNGSEYGESCIESDLVKQFGGKVHIVKLLPDFSTTQLIKKIKSCD